MFRHLLVPVDFSDTSRKALDAAVDLAAGLSGRITLLHVGPVPDLYPPDFAPGGASQVPALLIDMYQRMAEKQEQALNALAKEAIPEAIPRALRMREGFPPDEILEEVKASGCDGIVMGTHGRSGMTRVLLGSVADRVIRGAQVPVVVVR